jgi:glutaredoxin
MHKQEPETNKKKTIIIAAVVVILFGAAFAGGRYYRDHKAGAYSRDHKYDGFAKCLTSKNAKMYGLYWCPHCADQKRMFGAGFEYVHYVECATKVPHELAAECKAAGVKLFPSWQFGAEEPTVGVQSLEELSQKTGCSLP